MTTQTTTARLARIETTRTELGLTYNALSATAGLDRNLVRTLLTTPDADPHPGLLDTLERALDQAA